MESASLAEKSIGLLRTLAVSCLQEVRLILT